MPVSTDLAVRAIEYAERLGKIASLEELGRAFKAAVAPLGLNATVCGVAAGPRIAAGKPFYFVDWPSDWLKLYEKEDFIRIDPIPRTMRGTGRATMVNEIKANLSARDPGWRVLQAGADFGLKEGMMVPMTLRDGSLGLISMVGDRDRLNSTERAFLELLAAATLRRAEEIDAKEPAVLEPTPTRRELDCLNLLVRGLGDREIAAKLGVSEATVRFHLDGARRKLGANSRAHLAALAIWLGLARL